MSEHGKGKYRSGRARAGMARQSALRASARPALRPGDGEPEDPEPATTAPATPATPAVPTRDVIGRMTGTDSPDLSHVLVREALLVVNSGKGGDEAAGRRRIRATMAALGGIAPRDSIEGMLAAQMVAVHEVAMQSLRLARHSKQTVESSEMNISQAVRLMALYTRQMDALARHRGRGSQTVTVGRVQVEPGAQAIVGNVARPSTGSG